MKKLIGALLAASALAGAGAANAQMPALTSAQEMARQMRAGWDTSHAGTLWSFTGYTVVTDVIPSNGALVGWDDGTTSQPGFVGWMYNGSTYYDNAGNPYKNAPCNAAASGWTGTSPCSFSGAGLTITFSNPTTTQWQTGVFQSDNQLAQGVSIASGFHLYKITVPASSNAGPIFPDVAIWSRGRGVYGTQHCYIEPDAMETNQTVPGGGYSATIQATTFHDHPSTCPRGLDQVQSDPGFQYQYTATVFDNNPHWFGMGRVLNAQGQGYFVAVSDQLLGGGVMLELARRRVLSQYEANDPLMGLASLGVFRSLTGVSTSATATMTINEYKAVSCNSAANAC